MGSVWYWGTRWATGDARAILNPTLALEGLLCDNISANLPCHLPQLALLATACVFLGLWCTASSLWSGLCLLLDRSGSQMKHCTEPDRGACCALYLSRVLWFVWFQSSNSGDLSEAAQLPSAVLTRLFLALKKRESKEIHIWDRYRRKARLYSLHWRIFWDQIIHMKMWPPVMLPNKVRVACTSLPLKQVRAAWKHLPPLRQEFSKLKE